MRLFRLQRLPIPIDAPFDVSRPRRPSAKMRFSAPRTVDTWLTGFITGRPETEFDHFLFSDKPTETRLRARL
jgi:hypothetical protein